ncbi:unnamed protein product [Ambrosiozyma monospora]|uniref:Unnamed protein product n=1 Tax=Ambrosiozyma monospora TaxID=43982 RepID=A0ACB5SU83_AMBMO|nr:unnamed protein product [Ambrosiozyma monospora]
MNESSLFFQCVPYMHNKLAQTINLLKYPETMININNKEPAHMDYAKVITGFVNFYYEQYLLEFSELLPKQTQSSLVKLISDWNSNKAKNQKQIEQDILNLVVEEKTESKSSTFDIFSNFTNIFNFAGGHSKHSHTEEDGSISTSTVTGTTAVNSTEDDGKNTKLTKFAATMKILKTNVENIKSLISMDLIVLILQNVKNSYELLLGLTHNSTTKELNATIYQTCSGIFVNTIETIINQHIQPGFDEALERLKNYNLKTKRLDNKLSEPLTNFIELVNVGDLIIQMIDIFYNTELVTPGIVKSSKVAGQHRDFLSSHTNKCDVVISKMETILDSYVADGLDVSINVILSEITHAIVDSGLSEKTYDLKDVPDTSRNSVYAVDVVSILDKRFSLLTGAIDKSILDIFQEEIGERFINVLVKLMNKKLIISSTGSILFISDLNYLYEFFQKWRIKKTVSYLKALKQIAQIYLIDCYDKAQCKELGKLVISLGRDNGVFNPEEVYHFTSRRSDWLKIKKSVDKLMYGFGAEDCVIM